MNGNWQINDNITILFYSSETFKSVKIVASARFMFIEPMQLNNIERYFTFGAFYFDNLNDSKLCQN